MSTVQLPVRGHEALCPCGGVEVAPSLACPSGVYWALDPEVAAGAACGHLHPTADGLHAECGEGRLHPVLASVGLYTNNGKTFLLSVFFFA